ncbi:MAG: hypothetical protein FWE85_05035 [Clostridiales bacterium]|nr:hypothetical protein [Clostridiales bacterium]
MGPLGETYSPAGSKGRPEPEREGDVFKREFYDEALLQTVNNIGKDFNGLWKKNMRRLKEAEAASGEILLAEELLRHVTDKLWLIRHEAQKERN